MSSNKSVAAWFTSLRAIYLTELALNLRLIYYTPTTDLIPSGFIQEYSEHVLCGCYRTDGFMVPILFCGDSSWVSIPGESAQAPIALFVPALGYLCVLAHCICDFWTVQKPVSDFTV